MKIQMCGQSRRGRDREQNEDSFWFEADQGIMVVADGLGDLATGKAASSIAVRAFREAMQSSLPHAGVPDDVRHIMAGAIGYANREILADIAGHGDHEGMTTTIVCLALRWNTCVAAHVGDSRAYLVRAGRIAPLTRDHSYVRDLVDYGFISAEEAASHPQRNLITRAVGKEDGAEADFTVFPAEENDRYLLCSDGLHGILTDEEILDIIVRSDSLDAARDALLRRALEDGATDNATLVLAQVTGLVREGFLR